MKKSRFDYKRIVIITLLFSVINAQGQKKYTPTQENLEAREWFQEAKFGMFIHWGVYSVMGGGGQEGIAEWIMQTAKIKVEAYEKLPQLFNPTEFNAKEWVSMAKAAGMKYITITTKHHDGFAMYDSKVSDYTIMKSTPFGRDILRELEKECKAQDIKLFAYYSQLDWHHEDYFPRGWTGRTTGRQESGSWEKYLQYQDAQIKELATNYDIAGFWFDGWWDQAPDKEDWHKSVDYRIDDNNIDWRLERTYKMIHDTKSHLLIGNNHHEAPFQGEDFQMFEKDLPGENTTGFGTSADNIGELPFETCETINGSWGFNLIDNNHKTLEDLVRYIVNAAGRNTNFLLNVGPMPNGKIQKEHIQVLKELGLWMGQYGETIYGTRGGAIGVSKKYVTTEKDNRLFFHILDDTVKEITFSLGKRLKRIERFDTKQEVKFKKRGNKVTFTVPRNSADIVTTVEVVLKK
ncbi:MAG: alpha-L-fucosidase [Flavobacteriaceae bacterium]